MSSTSEDWIEESWDEPTYDQDDQLDLLIAEDESMHNEAQYQLEQVENHVNHHVLTQSTKQPQAQQSISHQHQQPPVQQIVHQSINQSINQSIDLTDHNHVSVKRRLSSEINQSTNNKRARRLSIDDSINQSINHSLDLIDDSVDQSLNSINQSYTRQWVFHRQPIAGDFTRVKDAEGNDLFLAKSDHIDYEGHGLVDSDQSINQSSNPNSIGLIDGDIRIMLNEIEEAESQRAIAMSLQATQSINQPINQSINRTAGSSKLWVDKYSPQRFTELLSPDEVNRSILSWLMQWDTCVFGEDRQTAKKHQLDNNLRNNQSMTKMKSKSRLSINDLLASRPSERVLLLSGPAGLGKTTLAHIIAAHAGYAVIELNASDDRTEDVLIEKVRGGVEYSEQSWSKGGLGHGRPHCLILDEIDGIADTGGEKNAIAALCKLVSAEATKSKAKVDDHADMSDGESSEDEQQSTTTTEQPKRGRARGNKKTRSLPPLRRPIICICNDPWIPALRPLRAIAVHYKVAGSNRDALLSRLKYIAKNEKMNIEDRAVSALIERVNGDVRSAIHSLQFLHERKGSGRLSVNDLAGLSVGVKDMQASRQDLIERVFSNPTLTSKKSKGNRMMAGRVDPMLVRDLNRSHDNDRLVSTMHQNYLSLPSSDTRLTTMSRLSHSFSAVDERGGMYDNDDGDDTSNGLTYLALRIHEEAAKLTRSIRLDLNSSASYALFQRSQNHHSIATTWLMDTQNEIARTGCTLQRACVELLSHVLAIISPSIRPLPFTSLSKLERKRIDCVIQTMTELSLTYRPDTSQTIGFVHSTPFEMQPQLDQLARYEFTQSVSTIAQATYQTNSRFKRPTEQVTPVNRERTVSLHMADFDALSHKVRQMLAREIEIEQMRKSESQRPSSASTNGVVAPAPVLKKLTPAVVVPIVEPDRPRKTTFLSEHSAKIRARNAPKQAASRQGDSLDPSIASRTGGFHFAFKEGFTQAVRRPVKHGFFI